MDESTEDDTQTDTADEVESAGDSVPADAPAADTEPAEPLDSSENATAPANPVDTGPTEPGHRPDSRTTVLLLGSGELSSELAVAFQRLGAVVLARGAAAGSTGADSNDAEELSALVDRIKPTYVVAESTAVGADAVVTLAERGDVEVFPTPRSTRLSMDREALRRLAADELGLPTVPFWFAGSAEELAAVAQHAGFPMVVKPVVGAPGDGQSVLVRPDDVEPAWYRAMAASRFGTNRVMAETIVEVDYAVTLLTVRTTGPTGPALHFCEPIGHYSGDGNVLEAWQPQTMTPAALDAAKSIAARIVNSLGGRGVFSVELLIRGDEVYFADVSARPHDSGLVTLRSQRLSEFELHARAILGVAVDTIMISPGAVEVVYQSPEHRTGRVATQVLAEALSVPESDVRVFEHPDARSSRRLGVALATGPNVSVARDRARYVGAAVRKLP
jgi:phosphoribosylglycinamide formyltransferase 2